MLAPFAVPCVCLVSVKVLSTALACYEERCIFNHNWHLLVDFDCIGCCPWGCNPVHVTDMNDLLSIIFSLLSVALIIRFCNEDNRLTFYSHRHNCEIWIGTPNSASHATRDHKDVKLQWRIVYEYIVVPASLLDTPNTLIYNSKV